MKRGHRECCCLFIGKDALIEHFCEQPQQHSLLILTQCDYPVLLHYKALYTVTRVTRVAVSTPCLTCSNITNAVKSAVKVQGRPSDSASRSAPHRRNTPGQRKGSQEG